MKPMYTQVLEASTSDETSESPCSFRIDEEVQDSNHLANAVLRCYMLISMGLIRTSSDSSESGGR